MTVKPRRTLLVACAVAALATVAATPAPAAKPAPVPAGPRLWAAAGPNFGRSSLGHGATGYALGGGIEFGRVVSLALEVGYEHLPTGREPYLVSSVSPGPAVLRVEPASSRSLISGTVGVRAVFAGQGWEPFVDLGLGAGIHRDPGVRIVDPATGAVIASARSETSSALVAEGGVGARTHRKSGCDFLLAFRARWITVAGEDGIGQSLQLRIGLLAP